MSLHPLVNRYQYADCRLLGHLWHVVPSDWTPKYGVPMTCRCERCDIERRDSVNRNTGEVESRKYQYPDGYLFHRDEGMEDMELPRRTDFRLRWLDSEVDKLQQMRRS